MCAGVFADKGSSHVNKATLATTLVLKTGSTHRDEGIELEIGWVNDEARSTCHAIRISVDDLNDTEVGIIHLDGVRDLLALGVLVDTIDRLGSSSTTRASEVGDNLAECHVGDERQRVSLTVDREDRRDDVVERGLVGSGGRDACSRGAVCSRNVSRASRVEPVTETAKGVWSACAVLDRAVAVGADTSLNVPLKLAHRLSFSLCDVRRAYRVNGLLEVRYEEIAAEDLDVVTEASALCELVGERGHISSFGDTRGDG